MHKGSCLCGAVQIEVAGPLPPPDACHCRKCRRWSGHFWASADIPRSAITVSGEEKVAWYQSSAKVRRGFCAVCGSVLLFDPAHRDWIGVAMGVFDAPTGVQLAKHIFVASKGDYYRIADPVPQEH